MSAPRLLLVRHGESTWNRRGVVQGQTSHVPLTPTGHRQAAHTARLVSEFSPHEVWTSDQVRAWQTAEHIATAAGLAPRSDVRLRERSYGRDESLPYAQVPALGRRDLTAEGGESFDEVVDRVGSFLAGLTAGPGPVVAVTHGDTLQAALTWLGVTLDRPAANGCVIGPLPLIHDRRTVGRARERPPSRQTAI